MRPHKTEKAHDALRHRPADVSVLERRILILSDGLRDGNDIIGLLGEPARSALVRLQRDGYLADRVEPETPSPAAPAAPAPRPSISPDVAATTTAPRRSIAAARMYVLDMLQLQRSNDAAMISSAIRACREQDELVAHLLRGLRCIHSAANASLSRRVAERLAEIVPKQYLPELDVFRDALLGDRSAA